MRIAGEIFHAAVWGKWMDQIPPEGNIYELEKMDARRTPGGGPFVILITTLSLNCPRADWVYCTVYMA